MTYEIIQDLCESQMFRSRQAAEAFGRERAKQAFYLYLISVLAIQQESSGRDVMSAYLSRTAAFGNFRTFRPSGTDLYVLGHLALGESALGERLTGILRRAARGQLSSGETQATLMTLEKQLGVTDVRLKTLRRQLGTWGSMPISTRKGHYLYLTRELRSLSNRAEILPATRQLAGGSLLKRGAKGVLKVGGLLALAGLAGYMLGSRYDTNKNVRFIRSEIFGESKMTKDSNGEITLDQFQELMDNNPLVDSVESVDTTDEGITAVVRGRDGGLYAMAFTVLEEPNGNENLDFGK